MSQEKRQCSSMNSAFFWHSPASAHWAHSGWASLHASDWHCRHEAGQVFSMKPGFFSHSSSRDHVLQLRSLSLHAASVAWS